MRRGIFALLLCVVCAGCAELRPDLTRVYPNAALAPKRPVIIIPGAFGSRLKDTRTGDIVWGRFTNLLRSRFRLVLNPLRAAKSDLLDLPIDSTDMITNSDNLKAFDIFDGVAGRAFYKRIVRTLVDVAGYRFGDIADPHPGEDCFAFYYDWRRDVVENAQLLGAAIERIRAVQSAGGKPTKVDLIGHSLGGLIARYYVKYGTVDVLGDRQPDAEHAGANMVDTVVLIGVPNEGSIDSLESHNHGVRIVRPLPPEAILTMPAAYQGLPRSRVGPFIDASGRTLDIDLYDPANWEKYGWSIFDPVILRKLRDKMLEEFGPDEGDERFLARLTSIRAFQAAALARAKRLNAALDRPGRAEETVRYFAFGGDCTPTPARALILQDEHGGWSTIFRFKDVPRKLATPKIERLMVEPGDGSVTRSSLMAVHNGTQPSSPQVGLPLDYPLFLCGTHRSLTENITFQDNLLQFLLYRR